jgi:hypothetical protein
MPLGSVIGGLIGTYVGIVPALIVGAAVSSLSVFWVLHPRILSIRTQPEPATA